MNKFTIFAIAFALGIAVLACIEFVRYNSYRSITLELEVMRSIRGVKISSLQEIATKRGKIPITEINEAELLRHDNDYITIQRDIMALTEKEMILQGESDRLIKYNVIFRQ